MKRFEVAAFAIEPGEVELHHELVQHFADDKRVTVPFTLTDRRATVVLPVPRTGGWLRRTLALVFSSSRIVLEQRRDTFARLELRSARQWSGPSLVLHDRDGTTIEVAVADPALWEARFDRWVRGDLPPSPIPDAVLRSK